MSSPLRAGVILHHAVKILQNLTSVIDLAPEQA
jgi:hypothetical protein